MIRFDPERNVYTVDIAAELMGDLRESWSPPVQLKCEHDELVMRSMVEVGIDNEGGGTVYMTRDTAPGRVY